MDVIVWLILVAIMLVIEICTMGLTTIWFGLGAVVAAVAAGCSAPVWLQIVLFSAVSVAVMLLVRPFALKFMNKNRARTNIDELIGQEVVVIETIDNPKGTGRVRLRGVEWMARSAAGEVIGPDDVVTIESIAGVKLIVRRKAEQPKS